jgi:hypothetical protein
LVFSEAQSKKLLAGWLTEVSEEKDFLKFINSRISEFQIFISDFQILIFRISEFSKKQFAPRSAEIDSEDRLPSSS